MAISYDDFAKLDIRVGTILEAGEIPNSEKLLKLLVDIGEEKRTIIAGIKKAYSPEILIGKQIVVLSNLLPRSLMGETSNGMLLAAGGEDGLPVILTPEKEISPGSRVR
jgi:methionyl-tRNA synthetase